MVRFWGVNGLVPLHWVRDLRSLNFRIEQIGWELGISYALI